jgi:murein DD-endopeptidase MepM/ murein hydrolase activator NlpD
MKRKSPRGGGIIIPALVVCFAAGIMTGWWLRSGAPIPTGTTVAEDALAAAPTGSSAGSDRLRQGYGGQAEPALPGDRPPDVAATTGEPLVGPARPSADSVISALRARGLRLPLDDADANKMEGGFAERRNGDRRGHEAVDLLAPRNTPVHAVDDGTIEKLFLSAGGGGITIYQFDPTGRFCYYYAHLERYADGLREGQRVSRGDVIGYVGTSGNAPPNTPHLHFAIFELDEDRRWWKGRAIDPYFIFRP